MIYAGAPSFFGSGLEMEPCSNLVASTVVGNAGRDNRPGQQNATWVRLYLSTVTMLVTSSSTLAIQFPLDPQVRSG